jgi:hypothetical protein
MLADFLSKNYPSGGGAIDGQYLYRALGTFWTQVFQDQEALRGYTAGMAEELIQSYYRLTETVNSLSVKHIDVFHTVRWKPIVIKKSEFNRSPFVFEPGEAVFGIQPPDNKAYAGQLFRFGFSKESANKAYFSFTPKIGLHSFGLLTNRIISPSLILVPGVDVVFEKGVMYFNQDLFNTPSLPKAALFDDSGDRATYTDSSGKVVQDEFLILWAYTAKIDEDQLYLNFGQLFDIRLPSSVQYKQLLETVMSLAVGGPTISALNAVFSILCKSPSVLSSTETVTDMYADDMYRYVITDKNTYKYPVYVEPNYSISLGDTLYAGECLTDSVKFVDSVIDPVWWLREFESPRVALPKHVFAIDNQHQLLFENAENFVDYTPEEGFVFPVVGNPADVALFNARLNLPENKEILLKALHLDKDTPARTAINPLNFVFSNFLKNNTILLKLKFYSEGELSLFFDLLPSIQRFLPPHVFILVSVAFQLATDELSTLNRGLTIPGFGNQQFCADGSVNMPVYDLSGNLISSPGARPGNVTDKNYYKDYVNRLFCISLGPFRQGQPLHADGTDKFSNISNLDDLDINNTKTKGSTATGIRTGLLRSYIPKIVNNPGEPPRGPSTKEVQSILLIDF